MAYFAMLDGTVLRITCTTCRLINYQVLPAVLQNAPNGSFSLERHEDRHIDRSIVQGLSRRSLNNLLVGVLIS